MNLKKLCALTFAVSIVTFVITLTNFILANLILIALPYLPTDTSTLTNNIQASHTYIKYSITDEILLVHNQTCFTAVGISMQPTLFPKNLICFKPPTNLKEGNIIAYIDKEKNLISHRIRTISPEGVIVQGDNNQDFETINISQIIGIVTSILLT